jgi:predicted dehydrogenase
VTAIGLTAFSAPTSRARRVHRPRNRGDQVLDAFLAHKDSEIVALCDIYQPYVDFAAKKAGGTPSRFSDYRKLLEMKDLDAVVINTPDHWHALQMIHACEAGKDVYVEKPLSLVVSEGRAMVNAARRHKRVVQVGFIAARRVREEATRARRRDRKVSSRAVVSHPE